MELKNKVALVTGGASGLGQATVETFVEKGAKVVILDINEENANKIIEELGEDNVMFVSTNIMEEAPVINAIDSIKDKFGALHIAVNCAGTGYPGRILGKEAPHPLDAFQFIVNLNLVGTFNVMRLSAELMDKNDPDSKGEKGVIINTASVAGYEGPNLGESKFIGTGEIFLGPSLSSGDIVINGIFNITVDRKLPIVVIGNADVPANWINATIGYLNQTSGSYNLKVIVEDGSTVVFEEGE